MAYNLKKIDRPASGAGAPSAGSRYAYVGLVKDMVSFPDTDENNVVLQGQPVFATGKGLIPVYITSSSRELGFETDGDQDGRSFKVSFKGSHPGSEREALEFVTNMLDEEFVVFIPGCQSSDPVKVLGRPCAPLIFKGSHKSDKSANKFELSFEQEVGSKVSYMLYYGSLKTLEVNYTEVDFSSAVTALSEVQRVKTNATAATLNITSLANLTESQVTFIGQETDPAKAATITEDTTKPVLVLTKNGTPWKAIADSMITLQVFQTSDTVVLIERWRT